MEKIWCVFGLFLFEAMGLTFLTKTQRHDNENGNQKDTKHY